MITNEKQYRSTKQHAASFRQAIDNFDESAALARGIDPMIVRAQREALKGQYEELQSQLVEYERLRKGSAKQFKANSLSDLPTLLIRARIARGLSQRDLAHRLGLREQQVQRYEADRYRGASLGRLGEVAAALGIGISLSAEMEPSQEDEVPSQLESMVAKLPRETWNEMIKRNWLEGPQNEVFDDHAFLRYCRAAFHESSFWALHKRTRGPHTKSDSSALLAWQARVLSKARETGLPSRTSAWNDVAWIKSLAPLSGQPNGPLLAKNLLESKGIAFVIEKHLPKTNLDGAVMMVDGSVPLVALTLRLDRLDNFWFVLLHEIGHLLLHRRNVLEEGFLDENLEEEAATSQLEKEADDFARSALIPDEVWRNSLSSMVKSDEEVIALAKHLNVGFAVVAGRLRRERNNYRAFTKLVGQGLVSELFGETHGRS